MVDFQSRDTRRGIGGNDGDDDDEDSVESEETVEDDDQPADETETADEGEDQPADEASDSLGSTGTDDSELQSQRTEEPATPDSEEQTDTDTTADSTGTAATEPQADQPAASKSVTSSAEPDSEPQPASITVDVAVVTVGTSTGQGTDPTGEQLRAALEAAGHTVSARERLRGEYDSIQQSVDTLVNRDDVDVVVTAGGTGIKPEESTIEAVHPLFEKALPGFGEAFRTLLFDLIGTGIVAVRSTAGIADGTPVFCLPGDEQAAVLAVEEIIATEAGELVEHLR